MVSEKQYMPAPKHPQEQQRLEILDQYRILDTPQEKDFNDIVLLASQICETPISLISLVASDRQWFKAEIGASGVDVPLDYALCSHAILQDGFFEIQDLSQDPKFKDNTLLVDELKLRYYGGALLQSAEGLPIGTLCVLDYKPHQLSELQKFTLMTLAKQVMTQLELRKSLRERQEGQIRSDNRRRVYETFLANTPEHIYIIDNQKRFTFANTVLLNLWGKTLEEIQGKRVHDLGYEPSVATLIEGELDQVITAKKTIHGTVPITRGEQIRIYDYIFAPVFSGDHEVVSIVGSTRDVTDRKTVEQKLRESEQELKELTNTIPQQVWSARPDGKIEYVNDFTRHYAGDIPVRNGILEWSAVVHPDDWPMFEESWKKSIETGEPYEVQQRIIHKESGEYRWNLTRGRALRDQSGIIVKWLGTNTDIQDHKQAIDELIVARNTAESASLAKTEFLTNISHEIRTPMNAIIGLTNILAGTSPLSDKQNDYLKTLRMSADSLLSLINDLLEIGKIEAKAVEFEKVPFSMNNIVQDVIRIVGVRAHEKGLVFTTDGESVQNRQFQGDPTRIRQIILNLCSNAVKFTEKGGVHIAIKATPILNSERENIFITVRDTGIGIASEKLDMIFERFIQADSSINRKYGGTGLGLTISKSLVENMGGRIHVESAEGKGSSFTVSLPLDVYDPQKIQDPKPAPSLIPPLIKSDQQKRVPHILLVEDYPPNVIVASFFLEQFGYTCDDTPNGYEAVKKVQDGQYDAVLMDVQMHGMDGLEATRAIRDFEQKEKRHRTAIIGMTAHALSGDRERCLAAGMDDYIAKPFDPAELRQKLKAVAG